MPAYMIARVDVTDPEGYANYTKHTPRIIAEHGGRFIARGGEVDTLEGEAETRRVVVVEFPSAEAARAFYASDDYQQAKALRAGAADGQFIIVDGMAAADWDAAVDASRQHTFD